MRILDVAKKCIGKFVIRKDINRYFYDLEKLGFVFVKYRNEVNKLDFVWSVLLKVIEIIGIFLFYI